MDSTLWSNTSLDFSIPQVELDNLVCGASPFCDRHLVGCPAQRGGEQLVNMRTLTSVLDIARSHKGGGM